MDFLIYIVVAVVAFWLGWHARGIIFLANISENPERVIAMLERIKQLNADEDQSPAMDSIEVRIEQVGKMVYAYAKDTDNFLGQGSTLEEALSAAADRFPDKKFWCDKPNNFSQTA